MARSGSFIAAIAASTSCSPAALSLLARSCAFSSRTRAFIAARSSAVNPLDDVRFVVVLFADFCVAFFAGFLSAIAKHLRLPNEAQALDLREDSSPRLRSLRVQAPTFAFGSVGGSGPVPGPH